MQKIIYKILIFFTLIINFTLFSCSVHYQKEKIVKQGQKYGYLIHLNQLISSDYAVYKLNKNTQYDFLFKLSLPDSSTEEELAQFNVYVKGFIKSLHEKGIKSTYQVIAKVDSNIKHYYVDLYYIIIK